MSPYRGRATRNTFTPISYYQWLHESNLFDAATEPLDFKSRVISVFC